MSNPVEERDAAIEKARDKKCRLVLAHMLSHLAKVLANPANADMIDNAAREAGQNELSGESRERLLDMIDQLAGRLSRGDK